MPTCLSFLHLAPPWSLITECVCVFVCDCVFGVCLLRHVCVCVCCYVGSRAPCVVLKISLWAPADYIVPVLFCSVPWSGPVRCGADWWCEFWWPCYSNNSVTDEKPLPEKPHLASLSPSLSYSFILHLPLVFLLYSSPLLSSSIRLLSSGLSISCLGGSLSGPKRGRVCVCVCVCVCVEVI